MAIETESEREPLTRRAVVDAALTIADEGGLDAVSVRKVAHELGVTPMALYRYVESKEELLYAIAERAFEEFELPTDTTADWREQIRELGRSFRRLLLAHPAIATLYSLHPSGISPNGARVVEVVLRVLREAGFSARDAAQLESACEQFVLALVVIETHGEPRLNEEEIEAHTREVSARVAMLSPDEFPNVIDSGPHLCKYYHDPDQFFELAFDLIVGGLEKLLEQPR